MPARKAYTQAENGVMTYLCHIWHLTHDPVSCTVYTYQYTSFSLRKQNEANMNMAENSVIVFGTIFDIWHTVPFAMPIPYVEYNRHT